MTSPPLRPFGPPVPRVADLQLRGSTSRLATRVYWPAPCPDGAAGHVRRTALLVLVDGVGDAAGPEPDHADALARNLCTAVGVVVLALAHPLGADRAAALRDAGTALGWAADHAAELGADPRRLIVAGAGSGAELAAAVAREAHEQGWPEIVRQVLLCPAADAGGPDGSLAGVAPATVVTLSGGADGPSYGTWLRRAGVRVDELRYEGLPPGEPRWTPWSGVADLVLADLARSLQHRLGLPPTATTHLDLPNDTDDHPTPTTADTADSATGDMTAPDAGPADVDGAAGMGGAVGVDGGAVMRGVGEGLRRGGGAVA
jgi:acetyl esterase/lipase